VASSRITSLTLAVLFGLYVFLRSHSFPEPPSKYFNPDCLFFDI
jgi:hypothetical protein